MEENEENTTIRVLKDKDGKVVVPADDLMVYFRWERKFYQKWGILFVVVSWLVFVGWLVFFEHIPLW